MKRYTFLTFLLILFVSIGFYFYTANESSAQAENEVGITVGKTAPVFILKNINADDIHVDAVKDKKVMVLNFWATWCPPCREEMPELEKFYKNYGTKVQFFGIDEQEPADKVSMFLQNNGYTYPILLDTNGEIGQRFKVNGIPTTVIIDAKGTIIYRKTGGVTANELKAVLDKAGVNEY